MRPTRTGLAVLLLATVPGVATAGLLVAHKSDDTISLVDTDTGRAQVTLPTGVGPHEVTASPDGRVWVISDYGRRDSPGSTLTVVEWAGPRRVATRVVDLGEHRRPHGLAWLPGDRVAVTTEGSRHLLVVDPKSGKLLQRIATGQEISHMLATTPDGTRAFVANIGSGSVTVIDLAAGRKLRDIETGAGAEGIAVTPDGSQVWVSNRAADTLTVIDARTLEVLAEIPCPGFPIRVAVSPDGRRVLVSCARSGEVAVFDVETRAERVRRKLDLAPVEGSARRLFGDRFGESPVPVGLVIDPDGKRAWVAATQADVVVVIDPETLDVQGLIATGREPDGMAHVAARP